MKGTAEMEVNIGIDESQRRPIAALQRRGG